MRKALVLLLLVAGACAGTIAPEYFESKYGRCVSTGGQLAAGGYIVTQLSTTCYTAADAAVKDAVVDDNPDDLQPPCACGTDGGTSADP